MEREILFRGKGIVDNEWHYGSYLKTDDCINNPCHASAPKKKYHICEFIHGDWNMGGWGNMEVIPESIGQFTGVCDKNGTKIFEGDIIKGKRPYGEFWIVKWDKKRCGFFLSGLRKCDFAAYDKGYKINSGRNEVIGNIHDNKELLK